MSRSSAKRQRKDAVIPGSPLATPNVLERMEGTLQLVVKMLQQLATPAPAMSSDTLAAIKASNALSASPTLSDEQKAQLFEYFCNNPTQASALPDDQKFLDAIFLHFLSKSDMV